MVYGYELLSADGIRRNYATYINICKDKVKYVSKPFDFEAMCIINDAHNDENKKGPLSICRDALDYMFVGYGRNSGYYRFR